MNGRNALLGAAVFFAVFAVNIVVGKVAVLGGATTVPGLGDVGEFLVLFAAVVLFIAACLARERAQDRENND
jgi:heme A synthase